MHGYFYSLRKNLTFSRTELLQLFWTSLVFAFILTFRKWGAGDEFDALVGIKNLILALLVVILSMLAHVSLQKAVAIRLGYKATYSYWLNGLLICLFLGFLSFGFIIFILPGAVMIEHVPSLRLGKFRYGTNLKDIARVALAGPIAHILIVLILGLIFFGTGKSDLLFSIILVNLLIAIYSMLPIPKIDFPTRMDSGTDGLGMFYFSRTLYVLVYATILIFSALILISTSYESFGWLFILAFILGCLVSIIYSVAVEQKN